MFSRNKFLMKSCSTRPTFLGKLFTKESNFIKFAGTQSSTLLTIDRKLGSNVLLRLVDLVLFAKKIFYRKKIFKRKT